MTPEELLVEALKQSKKIVFGNTIGTDSNGNCTVQGKDGSILARSPDQISAGSAIALKTDGGKWYAVSPRPTGIVRQSTLFKRKNRIEEEIEEAIAPIKANYNFLYSVSYSGDGSIGGPFSDVTLGYVTTEVGTGIVFTFDNDTGLLTEKEGEATLFQRTQDLSNTVIAASSILIQDFNEDIDKIGSQIGGSFVDHPGGNTFGYNEISITFNLASQVFLKEWDIIGDPIDGLRPIELIDNEVLRLDELLDLDKRKAVLTALIASKGLEPLIQSVRIRIAEMQQQVQQYFAINLSFALDKFVEDKLPDVPSELPEIDPTEEFFNLSANIDLMKIALQSFLANADYSTESVASRAVVKCTKEGERAIALQAFITTNNFTNYFASTSIQPLSGRFFWYYFREDWTDINNSPFELELSNTGVPYSYNYGMGFQRIGEYYYLYTDVAMSGIPFGESEYNMVFRWRKRGNTEWFSL
jgi:hypothetical protein